MTATVRLDTALEKTLNSLSDKLHKKRSDIIRDAIAFYAKNIENSKKEKILEAVKKTKKSDKIEYESIEGTLSDGI